MAVKNDLIAKIQAHEARVGIVGLGYVGLPLVLRFAEEHFPVLGFDVDPAKVRKLQDGESYIRHIPAKRLRVLIKEKRFESTTDFQRLAEADCIIICVPTPLTPKKDPDLQYIENTTDAISRTLRRGQLVCLESTTYPGTTEEILLERFRATGLEAGSDYFLIFSPEREDPGNPKYSTRTIPKVVGGITPDCLEVGTTLYGQVIDRVVPVSSTRAAELVKLLENIYRCVNIALVNELKLLGDRMDIDVWEVIDAASTKPFGFTPFYPGPGLGGHCIPIDPFYLSWKAKEYDFNTRFIELAGEVNEAMPAHVVQFVAKGLNQHKKAMNGSKILMLGMAYKKDIDDLRESPSLTVIELLRAEGAEVLYNDPYFPTVGRGRHYNLNMTCTPLENLGQYDCVLIMTDHSDYDYEDIVARSKLVVDSRNATKGIKSAKIVRC